MKNFKLFQEQLALSRKYIALQYDEQTQENMRVWCYENGFDLSKKFDGSDQPATDFDFHTTVFFSTTKHIIPNTFEKIDNPVIVYPHYMEYLGENKDIPVLKIASERLLDIRSLYERSFGMKDAWPEYKPHISVSYNRDALPDLDKIKLPDFPLVADTLKIDDAKDF